MEVPLTYSNDRYHPWLGGYAEMRIDSETFDTSRVNSTAGVPVLLNHDYRMHVGRVKSVGVQRGDDGTTTHSAVVDIPEDLPGNADVVAKLANGMLTGVSVGAGIDDAKLSRDNKGATDERPKLTIRNAKLNEVSLTPLPLVAEVGVNRSETQSVIQDGIVMDENGVQASDKAAAVLNRAIGDDDGVGVMEAVKREIMPEINSLKAKIDSIQFQPKPVDKLSTPLANRPQFSLDRLMEVQRTGGKFDPHQNSANYALEQELLERVGKTAFRNDAEFSIPFAALNQVSRERRDWRRMLDAQAGIARTVLPADIDDSLPVSIEFPGDGQLALDSTISPIMSRMDVNTGAVGNKTLSVISDKGTQVVIADGGNFTDDDLEVSESQLSPKTYAQSFSMGRTALNFDGGEVAGLFERAVVRLLNNKLLTDVFIGLGGNAMTGIAEDSGLPTAHDLLGTATTGEALTILFARDVVTAFDKLKGDGGRNGRRDRALIASTDLYELGRKTAFGSSNDRFIWEGGPTGVWTGELPAYWYSPFEIAAKTNPTVAALALEGMVCNLDAVYVQLWGRGFDVIRVPSPTAALTHFQLLISADCKLISPSTNGLLVRRRPA